LGLATDAKDFDVPDYSMPVGEIYSRLALTCIQRNWSLRVLCDAGTSIAGGDHILDLPSWVPNWTCNTNVASPFRSCYCATIDRRADVQFLNGYKTLHVCGITYDKVSSLESIHPLGSSREVPLWKSFLSGDGQQIYRTGITRLQALFRTLLLDREPISSNRLKPGSKAFFDAAAAFLHELGNGIPSDPQQGLFPQAALPEKDPDYITNFLRWRGESRDGRSDQTILEPFLGRPDSGSYVEWPMNGDMRRGSNSYPDYSITRARISGTGYELLTTDQGLMGIALRGAQKGDLICVLFGSNVPFILRKIEDHYVLVGACFVLGLVDGEAMQSLENGEVCLQKFHIS